MPCAPIFVILESMQRLASIVLVFVLFVAPSFALAQTAVEFVTRADDDKAQLTVTAEATPQLFIEERSGTVPPAPAGYRFITSAYTVIVLADGNEAPAQASVALTVPSGFWSQSLGMETGDGDWTFLETTRSGATLTAALPVLEGTVAAFQADITLAELADLQVRQAAVLDATTGTLLATYGADRPMAIASLTKMVTAMVVLDTKPRWDRVITYKRGDVRPGAKLRIRVGDRLTVRDLFHAMLIGSANNATAALARSTGLSSKEFVRRMNAKAAGLGLRQTRFVEPTGLNPRNQSTAAEYALLAAQALQHPTITAVTTKQTHIFSTKRYRTRHRIVNTNKLLGGTLLVRGGKTGYLTESGYNFMLKARPSNNADGHDYIAVVLGGPTFTARFSEAVRLVEYAAASATQ